MRYFFLIIFFLSNLWNYSQNNSELLENIINNNIILKKIIDKKEVYKPQIIYTQINRDENNKPFFTNHTYLLDSSNYFYCASLVKLPCSIMALEKINELKVQGLNKNSYMFTKGIYPCHKQCEKDTSSATGFPSLSNYIAKMLLVSDNFSYSRVYEFLNPDYIQNRLKSLGYPNARIIHRFDALCKEVPGFKINPIDFYDEQMNLLYAEKAYDSKKGYSYPFGKIVMGKDVRNKKGKLISEKKDFTYSNFIPLNNYHSILQRLLFQNHLPENEKYKITEEDWKFLVKHLAMYPRETDYPRYNKEEFYDSYKKYFIYGSEVKTINSDTLRVFNMIGYSYGFIVDCAYIVNYKTKTEFMLSAVLYTNSRNSFGSGVYEYKNIAIPFLKELSLEIYKLEVNREKKYLPDLKEFELFGE